MENPASLLRRAERSRRRKKLPVPAAAPERIQGMPSSAPRHTSSHANYTALMRSHDRLATRHIASRDDA